jgi:hypothetical protein
MTSELRDVTGFRGEKIVELRLTDYKTFPEPLFRPAHLGEKWPAIDYLVELTSIPGRRLYFFAQVKSTTIAPSSRSLRISTKKKDIERLLQIPGPTYLLGVHEPSERIFVRSVHIGTPARAITSIPLHYELTAGNLKQLHGEVSSFWPTGHHKPTVSRFA